MDTPEDYNRKREAILEQFRSLGKGVRLGKDTSNLFRSRQGSARKLDVRSLSEVISIDPVRLVASVEGMTTFETFVRETLRFNLLPMVVPELRSITVGGAVSGVAIESSSFRYGLVHESVLEMEILLASGQTVLATRTNAYKDLFFAIPNSYGTLGYILRLTLQLVRAQPFVKLEHRRYRDARTYFRDLESVCTRGKQDFVDGTVFSSTELYLTTGTFVPSAPRVSDYTGRRIYYRSIREKKIDYLTAHDYIWRWDTDWFWCSKNVGAQHPLLRPFFGLIGLRSTTYWKIMSLNRKLGLTEAWRVLRRAPRPESVIQDVQTPVRHAEKFLAFFFEHIRITPVWICPVIRQGPAFPLYPLSARTVQVNFGFWDTVPLPAGQQPGYHNRKIESMISTLGGRKSLYSDSYYTEEEFWKNFDKKTYAAVKRKYDPKGRFKGLFEKTVQRR